MRRPSPDQIPDSLVRLLLEAAIAAPNGANRQCWGFIVVRDPDLKAAIQAYYSRALRKVAQPIYDNPVLPPGVTAARFKRQLEAVVHLTEHFHEAPVWIVACYDAGWRRTDRFDGDSIYPAVQNILLAARALGLGATLTTRHRAYRREVDRLLNLPRGQHAHAIIPIGYPTAPFGVVRRGPLQNVVHLDRWGTPWPGLEPQPTIRG
jgi:nitroreductase